MAMSRKDYVKVAATIKEKVERAKVGASGAKELGLATEDLYSTGYGVAVSSLARDLATVFKDGNPRFRFDTFYAACGLDEWGMIVWDD
jgi:hypothetical protein